MCLPWVVVAPEGVVYLGLHQSENEAWQVALGWPPEEEIFNRRKEGWYAAQATTTWKKPGAS